MEEEIPKLINLIIDKKFSKYYKKAIVVPNVVFTVV